MTIDEMGTRCAAALQRVRDAGRDYMRAPPSESESVTDARGNVFTSTCVHFSPLGDLLVGFLRVAQTEDPERMFSEDELGRILGCEAAEVRRVIGHPLMELHSTSKYVGKKRGKACYEDQWRAKNEWGW